MEPPVIASGSPKPYQWPNKARLAVSLVVNVEEGAEANVVDGDKNAEPVDELGISLRGDVRNFGNESNYQYGLIEGAPRVLTLLAEREMRATFTAAAVALERAPELAEDIVAEQHEVAAHGHRWIHQFKFDEDQERAFIRAAADSIERSTGRRPDGWLSRYLFTENTRRLLVEEGFRYHMDDYCADEPYWDHTEAGSIVVLPYAIDTNDMKMWTAPAYTPDQWLDYALETLRVLYEEGHTQPRMMSLGLHLRVIGRPGRIGALQRFLDQLVELDDVWVATRSDIAHHFMNQVDDPFKPATGIVVPSFGSERDDSQFHLNVGRDDSQQGTAPRDDDRGHDAHRERDGQLEAHKSIAIADATDSRPSAQTVGHFVNLASYQRDVNLHQEFEIGSDFLSRFRRLSRDELRFEQNRAFVRVVERAWDVPFYQRLWSAAGIERGDIRGLDQIQALPVFDKRDLMQSIRDFPPWGDYHGIDDFRSLERDPVIMHTTSGTTGKPQVIPFGPRSRAVQNLLLARVYLLQGLRPEDVVQSVYGHGLVNGGHYIREAVTQWTGARLLSAGTGLETPSERQIELLRDFDVTVLLGFPDYLMKLAETARETGYRSNDFCVRLISGHLGSVSRSALSAAWNGAAVFDWYGVGDTGVIAGEGPDQDGLYVMEDAHYLELLDIETSAPTSPGDSGDMVVTCLFKDDVYPIIRFNTHDVSALLPGASSLGLQLQRLAGFLGRSDNMVKVKGVNVFPEAVGQILSEELGEPCEYQCRLSIDESGRDVFVVHVESARRDDSERLLLLNLLRRRLGVGVDIMLHRPGSLASATGLQARQKPVRFIDERP